MEKMFPIMELSFTIPFFFGHNFLPSGGGGARRDCRDPPGLVGFSIIPEYAMMDQLNHIGSAKLAKQYGGIFLLRMGSLHVATVSTPDVGSPSASSPRQAFF
ncbi:hypothetical protein GBA52_028707 [Prunus armeniaca]|nr:hypothetical protein GBA52_028707 [Prunus armeniaca]